MCDVCASSDDWVYYGYGIDFVGRKLKYDKNDVRSIWWAAICCFAVRAKCARHTQLRNRLHLNSRWVSGCRGSFRNRQIIRWSPFKIKLWMRRSADTFVHVRQSRMTMSSKFSFVHFISFSRDGRWTGSNDFIFRLLHIHEAIAYRSMSLSATKKLHTMAMLWASRRQKCMPAFPIDDGNWIRKYVQFYCATFLFFSFSP